MKVIDPHTIPPKKKRTAREVLAIAHAQWRRYQEGAKRANALNIQDRMRGGQGRRDVG